MLFSSMIFLWVFLPAVIIGNYAISLLPFKRETTKIKLKNLFLLLASLFFYAWGGIYYLLIMLTSICLNFLGGWLIHDKCASARGKKTVLTVVIALNIALLFFFKYFNMLIIMLEAILAGGGSGGSVLGMMLRMEGTGRLGIREIVLPIGISFFTFQSMSYVIDVYREKAPVQKNILDFGLYVSLFPQLIAGPIVKYGDVAEAIQNRRESVELFFSGQKRFCYGLAKKVLLANTFAEVADKVWNMDMSLIGTPLAWFAIIAYSLQIYYDFSGYSDMAIGIGRMLGFQFHENFQYPYTSLSVQEFWRRWHISLSSWFREYVYIPLGGSRNGKGKTYRNLFIVFLLTGLWHGANFTFLLWGLFYAVILILERLFLGKLLQKNPIKPLNWLYTILLVMIGWVFFRSDTVFQAGAFLGQMFGGFSSHYGVLSLLSLRLLIALVAAVLCSGLLQRPLEKRFQKIAYTAPVQIADLLLQLFLLGYSILVLVSGSYNPFLYFQF